MIAARSGLVALGIFLLTLLLATMAVAQDSVDVWPPTEEPSDTPGLVDDGAWTEFELDRFGRRAGNVAIYDPLRDRVIVFGGFDRSNMPNNETWALSLSDSPAWTRIAASAPKPPARYFHSGIYDPLRDRVVIFGGYDGTHRNDVWALSLADTEAGWTLISPMSTPPAGRWGHIAVYDPTRDRMVIMGGHLGNQVDANDVWELSLSGTPTWTPLSPSGNLPAPRNLHGGAYDVPRDRLIVFGGETNWSPRGDLWSLDFSNLTWSELSAQGTLPTARDGVVLVSVPNADKLVLFGGYDGDYVSDAYELSLDGAPSWTLLTPAGSMPSGRRAPGGAVDLLRNRLIVVGGDEGPQRTADVWSLELDEEPVWSEIEPSPVWPVGRWGHALIHDPSRNRFLIIGGSSSVDPGVMDVWEYSLDSKLPWKRIDTSGVRPPGRQQHTAIYDPVGDRVVVFGGYDSDYRNETWSLTLKGEPRWTQLSTPGSVPLRRGGHVAVYDDGRKSMLVFGGYNGAFLSDVWSLSLDGTPTWKLLVQSGAQPAPRQDAAGIFDSISDRLVIFGGFGDDALFNDVWSLSLGTGNSWVELTQDGAAPSTRYGATAIFDEYRRRMIVFGGLNSWFPGTNDVWALSLTESATWSELSPIGPMPPRRYNHVAGFDPLGDRMMIFGGRNDAQNDDVWFLAWSAARSDVVRVPTSVNDRDYDLSAWPNPASASIDIQYRVAAARSIDLKVYDVSGRLVRSLVMGATLVGVQTVAWDLLDFTGQRIAPGTYFLRLTSGKGADVTERVTIIR
jgi:hypothetical protein